MSITIGDYSFDGLYLNTDTIEDKSGIYAIINSEDGKYYVIDIGESANVKTRLDNHDRKNCWIKNCTGTLNYAVLYTPNKQQAGRMEIEQELRDKYKPVCGDR